LVEILTSNLSFSQWNEIFGATAIDTAILDRIVLHATTVNIKGNSYRLKEEVKAGARPQAWSAASGSNHAGGIAEDPGDGFRTRRPI